MAHGLAAVEGERGDLGSASRAPFLGLEVQDMENLRTLVWRIAVKKGMTARVRRSWKLVAVLLPLVFPSLLVVTSLGLWQALTRTSVIAASERVSTELIIMVPLALWLLLVSILASVGVYTARLAIPLGVLLPPIIGLFLLTHLPHLPQLLDNTPQSWLIGLQVYRLLGGVVWLVVWASGEVKVPWFNVEAGSVDVLVGSTALPVAWWVASGSSIALAVGVAWNLIGLLDLALAIVISAIVKRAGPSYMVSLNTPVMAALKSMILGIVTLGVPLAIMLHLLSLWQLVGGH